MAREFTVLSSDGALLSGEESGNGTPVLLLHGLTATRRYVVMGSRLLERSGHRVITYDARAHGRSSAAPEEHAYTYDLLAQDAIAVLDRLGVERAVIAGASMGAHTALNVALHHPARVAGLVVITPAYPGADGGLLRGQPGEVGDRETGEPGRTDAWDSHQDRWEALSEGLRRGGVDGFMAAFGQPAVSSAQVAQTILTVTRQRLSQHQDLRALADCLRWLPRSQPFGSLDELRVIDVPCTVVISSDQADPDHPEAVGAAYARSLPAAQMVTDQPGSSPVAWQGSQLSKVIAAVAARAMAAKTT
ncbi:MAG: alpha/beta hydrolase [Solirubrobacteraceae bacterium]